MAEEVKRALRPSEQDAARVIDDLELQGVGAPIDVLKMEFVLAARRGAGNAIEEELKAVPVLCVGINPHEDGEGAGIAAHRGIVSGGEDLGADVGIYWNRDGGLPEGSRRGNPTPEDHGSRESFSPTGRVTCTALLHCLFAPSTSSLSRAEAASVRRRRKKARRGRPRREGLSPPPLCASVREVR